MKPVFLDSVGIIALWNERDQWHNAASTAFAHLRESRTLFVSTTYVIAECANALARTPARTALAHLVIGLKETNGLVFPTADDFEQSWTRYTAGYAGSPGLVDHLSFEVMRRLGLIHAFTHDEHFADAGFVSLF